ncbi:MAG TPA: hypothetical protein ENJ52_14705 [Aliiroseovarius sp.]|nr:hypothetical protein [Aliiroseovarius sp.]
MQEPVLIEGLANLLMPMSNVDLGGIGARKRGAVGPAVVATGNWVGGRFELTGRHIRFRMNAMNRRFQKDTGMIEIPLDDITGIDRGRMLWFFATADITTPTGRYRFRLPPGKTDRFLTQLRLLCTL